MEISSLVHFFFDAAGPGGLVVLGILFLACIVYVWLTRWILAGGSCGGTGLGRGLRKE